MCVGGRGSSYVVKHSIIHECQCELHFLMPGCSYTTGAKWVIHWANLKVPDLFLAKLLECIFL